MKTIIENISVKPDDFAITLTEEGDVTYVLYGYLEGAKKVTVELACENTRAEILGIIVGSSGECSIQTVQHHAAPHTTSDLHVKTVVSGEAQFKYRGVIQIDQVAQHSNAYQKNDNLILSKTAKVDTKPELEIVANDVRCTHGATVGKLDDEQIFYMRSRGIGAQEARALALQGFAGEIVGKIEDAGAKEEIREFLEKVL